MYACSRSGSLDPEPRVIYIADRRPRIGEFGRRFPNYNGVAHTLGQISRLPFRSLLAQKYLSVIRSRLRIFHWRIHQYYQHLQESNRRLVMCLLHRIYWNHSVQRLKIWNSFQPIWFLVRKRWREPWPWFTCNIHEEHQTWKSSNNDHSLWFPWQIIQKMILLVSPGFMKPLNCLSDKIHLWFHLI